MTDRLLTMARRYAIPMAVDAALVFLAYFAALELRFELEIPTQYLEAFRNLFPLLALAYCAANFLFGLYRQMWRYASALGALAILESTATATALILAFDFLYMANRPLPVSVVITGGILTLIAFAGVRYRWRLVTGLLWRWRSWHRGPQTRVLIVGAGEAGQLLAWQLQNQATGYYVVGFIDDDPQKVGLQLHHAKVLGPRHLIPEVVDREAVDTIVIAIHAILGETLRDIIALCQSTPAQIKILPSVFEMMQSQRAEPLIRDIRPEDFLGRKSVDIDHSACRSLLEGKTILVTGAGGSIGSELCRQISRFQPRLLLALDNNETSLYDLGVDMGLDLAADRPAVKLVVGDILRQERMEALFQDFRPQIVFHAAAYKHVPLMEEYPEEAILVNIQGTQIVAELAHRYGAERFVFISTDKAVNPSSVMGATKMVGELLVTNYKSPTRFAAVRFGNVFNSRGSVVPTFSRQIDQGGPVTITHPEMSRFFLSIPEAVSLVIQAATLTEGGDIFMLDMGEEIKIIDLAHRMIRLRGLRVDEDIRIIYTGVRPGEKFSEVLINAAVGEEKHLSPHPKIFRITNSHSPEQNALLAQMERLVALAKGRDQQEVVAELRAMVGWQEG